MAEYEAADRAARKLMYRMRKGFTAEQFDELADIVQAQENYRLQLPPTVKAMPLGVIVNLHTNRTMKREDARPEPVVETKGKTLSSDWFSPLESALRDTVAGYPGRECGQHMIALFAADRAGDDDGARVAAEWLAAYHGVIDRAGFEISPKIMRNGCASTCIRRKSEGEELRRRVRGLMSDDSVWQRALNAVSETVMNSDLIRKVDGGAA